MLRRRASTSVPPRPHWTLQSTCSSGRSRSSLGKYKTRNCPILSRTQFKRTQTSLPTLLNLRPASEYKLISNFAIQSKRCCLSPLSHLLDEFEINLHPRLSTTISNLCSHSLSPANALTSLTSPLRCCIKYHSTLWLTSCISFQVSMADLSTCFLIYCTAALQSDAICHQTLQLLSHYLQSPNTSEGRRTFQLAEISVVWQSPSDWLFWSHPSMWLTFLQPDRAHSWHDRSQDVEEFRTRLQ